MRKDPGGGVNAGWPEPRYAWYVAGVLMVAYAFAFVDRIVLSLLVPFIQKDLGLNDTQMGLLGGLAFSVTYTLFGLPVGRLADRMNRRNIIAAGTAFWSLATAACGLASGFWHLFWARVGVGIGEATLQPSASSLISDYFPPETRPKAYGLFVMGTSLGTAAAFLLVGLIIGAIEAARPTTAWMEGWRTWELVFIIVGLPGLLVAALMFTVREPARRETAKGSGPAVPLSEVARYLGANWQTFTAHHVGVMLTFLAIYGQLLFMPAFFVRVHGWTPAQIGTAFGIVAMTAGVFSALSSGWVASWMARKGRQDATLTVCLVGAAGVCLPGAIAPFMPTGELALLMFAVSGLFANWPSVGALSAINQVVPNQMRAQVTALYTLVVGLLAAGLGPLVVGFLTDRVFQDRMQVGASIGTTFAVCGALATLILAWGLGHFRETARAAKAWQAAE